MAGIDVVGYLANLMNTQAQTNLMNAQAQDQQQLAQQRGLQVQQMRLNQQDDAIIKQLWQDTLRGQQATQFRGDQQVDGDPLIGSMNKQLAREQQEAQQIKQMAALAGGQVSPEAQFRLQKEADAAERRVLDTEKELRLYQKDLSTQVGSQAGAVHDDDSFRQAYRRIAELNPMLARSLNVDRDANGIPFYGPKSQASMETLAQSAMTPAQQIDRSIKMQDELRKEQVEARQQQDERRKEQETDANIALKRAQVGATTALESERKQRTEQIQAKTQRLDTVASKPATTVMKQSAKDSIRSMDEFKGAKWDDTLDAFAADVADRANRIRADGAREGTDIGLDDARQQAIDELRGNVKKAEGKEGFLGFGSQPPGASYRRGAINPETTTPAPASKDDEALAGKLNRVGLKFVLTGGKVTGPGGTPVQVGSKAQYDMLPSGTEFMGADGKKWIKP